MKKTISAMITRWDAWFSDKNLRDDPRILAARHSHAAENAAARFRFRGSRLILDLASGICRDTLYLESRGLSVIGVDASLNGLKAARRQGAERAALSLVAADARRLPFRADSFDGVYSFGLLHEFTGDCGEQDAGRVIDEIRRVLDSLGLLVVAVLAGEPEEGAPVRLFSRGMLDNAMRGWRPVQVSLYEDIGCTIRPDYHIWYCVFAV